MDDHTTTLRSLGYHQDTGDRWVHAGLQVRLVDPALMFSVEPSQVEAFHDDGLWSDLRPPPRPLMDAELGRVVVELELDWNGWLGTWLSPSGLHMTQRELEDLGAEALSELESQRLVWLEEHRRRRFAGCLGMGAMVLWLGAGWLLGTTLWLLGMAAIAVWSWMMRPQRWPPELNPEGPDPEAAVEEGRQMLGPEWAGVASIVAPIPVDTDHVHLLNLERTISLDAMSQHFTPEGFMRILNALVPLDEDVG